MKIDELSKIKHIYRIYSSADKVVHCEKLPVVYINSGMIYYKSGRKSELTMIHTCDVVEIFNNSKELLPRGFYDRRINKYYLNVREFDSGLITDQVFESENEARLLRLKVNADRLRIESKEATTLYKKTLRSLGYD